MHKCRNWIPLFVCCKTQNGSYTPAIHDCNQIQRIQTTGLEVLTWKPCHLRNRKLTCDHFLESLNGMSMNDTEMGIRILFMINKHFHTIRYCYNYLRLYTITLLLRFGHRRAPLGPPFWAPYWGLFGDHLVWSCRDHAASHPRTEWSSSPQPIPLGEVGLCRFCETRGGGE